MFFKYQNQAPGSYSTVEIEDISSVAVLGEDFDRLCEDGAFAWLFARVGAEAWELPEGKPPTGNRVYRAIAVSGPSTARVILAEAGTSYLLNDHGSTVERI